MKSSSQELKKKQGRMHNKSNRTNFLLHKFDLKKTRVRQGLLHHFMDEPSPQTHLSIHQALQKKIEGVDGVTIYRNLQKFVELGVLHKLPDNKYLLCSHLCKKPTHILFSCIQCGKFWEIDHKSCMNALAKSLNHESVIDQSQPIFLSGVCKQCSEVREH